MGIQNPQTISLGLPKRQSDNVLASDYAEPNAAYLLSAGRYSPARYAMEMCYPRPDSETSPYAYHRIWQTGEPMDIPVRPMFGAYPYSYRILSSNQTGWTIGEFLTADANGDLVLNPNYGTLSNPSLVAGTHSIRVGIWDATGVFSSTSINISVGNNGFFAAPAATGNGSGSDANNCMSLINAHQAGDTISPAKNKILFLRGGDYSWTGDFVINADKALAVVNYRNEIPNITNSTVGAQFRLKTNDTFVKGLTFTGWGNVAVFRTDQTYYSRQAVWRCKFVDLYGITDQTVNEAAWFVDRANGTKRPYFLFSEIEYVNCDYVSGFVWYEVLGVAERQTWTTNKSTLHEAVWHSKAGSKVDLRHLAYDNTATVAGTVFGILHIMNNAEYSPPSGHARFCYVKCPANGTAITTNSSAAADSRETWIDHCTAIGAVTVRNYNGINMTYFDRNVFVNAAAGVSDPDGNGATVTNLRAATSGLVDANGRLLAAADVGLYGHIVRV